MRRPVLFRVAAAVVTLLVTYVAPAQAAPIVFPFAVTFTSGAFAGNSYVGSLSVDGVDCTAPGGLCDGTFDANGPLALLTFDITVPGTAFTIADDINFDDAPIVSFSNNVITAIGYSAVIAGERLTIDFDSDTNLVLYQAPQGVSSSGNLVLRTSDVPEPATLLLLGAGLGAIAVRRHIKARASSRP